LHVSRLFTVFFAPPNRRPRCPLLVTS
jgi:hypothetical protein